MGFLAERIGGVECTDVIEYLPHNGQVKYHIPAKKLGEKLWAHPWHLVHRAHLHTALREMAIDPDGKGPAAKLHLASRVHRVDAAKAHVVLADGTEIQGDLVVGADGVHSKVRAHIPGGDLEAFDSGKSAFRFLIPSQTLTDDPKTTALIKPGALSMWIGEDRRVVMYPCMNNTMMNFVLIHPTAESQADTGDGGRSTLHQKDSPAILY
jgi:2-polyprenyl-6-methoxyphenol hydroxylase-like FAD-dependent oxidoreductase